jgi:DNA (cytosine-5)-methyltransferase 1
MARKILVADLLCGAGGSSTGCARALAGLGLEMELVCVNHWGVAIETHKRNHPEARHYCQDISTVRPHIIVPEGYLDLLMASPTCTHHSVARGGKPTSDQQRSDPWHIITWLTELRVKRLIIENVWEFCGWGPVDARTGKPIKSRKGEYFRAWIDTIRRLGFDPGWRKLNAADFGDATTRQRFILMARSDGKTIFWPTPTHRKREEGGLELFPSVKPWRPAREIIDWSLKGKSILNRKKPLAPKTLARIYAGALKFGWPEPYLVILRNHMAGQSVEGPLPTIAAHGTHIGLAQPFIVKQGFRRDVQSVDEPAPTATTIARIGVVEPMLMSGRRNAQAKSVETDPIPALDTKGGVWLAEPFVLSAAHGVDVDDPNPHDRRVKSADDPLGAIHAGGGNFGVVEPFVLSRQGEGAPRSIDEPTPAQVAKHSHVLISPYYGSGSGETCETADEPLPTVTAKGRFGMVVPITHSDGSNRARDVSDPLPTLTTANRGELAFITAQHGEREGQAPRVHDIGDPAPTIAASGHVDLVEADGYDILFRMLEPHELAAAMGFTGDDAAYEFAGTKTEQIKQIGNAVSVAKMKACVSSLMADAAPKRNMIPPAMNVAAE